METDALGVISTLTKAFLEEMKAQRTSMLTDSQSLRDALINQANRHADEIKALKDEHAKEINGLTARLHQLQTERPSEPVAAAAPASANRTSRTRVDGTPKAHGGGHPPCPEAPAGKFTHFWDYAPGSTIGTCRYCKKTRDDSEGKKR